MDKHALLLRMNPEHWPRWHSQLAVYGHADVLFATNLLQVADIPLHTPVVVLAADGRGIVAWGQTTGAVASRDDASWMDTPAQHRTKPGTPKTRVYARLRRTSVPLAALHEMPATANLDEMAREPAIWLTEEQYREVCELCGKAAKMALSVARRSVASPSSPTPHEVPGVKTVKPTAFEILMANFSVRARGILEQLKIENAASFKSVTKAQIRGCPGWNWKKVREITDAQAELLILERQESYRTIISTISFENAPAEVLDAIRGVLDVRSVHLLENLVVDNLQKFMRLDRMLLLEQRNAGRKTAERITGMQYQIAEFAQSQVLAEGSFRPDRLLNAPFLFEKDDYRLTCGTVIPSLSFENAPTEVFDAIRGKLSVRALHTLEAMSVGDLKSFMALDRTILLSYRNCGKKSANMILQLQGGLFEFARKHVQPESAFRPESLLAAPCLTGSTKSEENLTPAEGVLADPENPAPWLVAWVQGLAPTERHARVFLVRMGMLGAAPKILASLAQEYGVTRERIRQMQVVVEKRAKTQYQQFRLRPLAEAAAAVVNERGGLIGLEELTQIVLGRGKDGDQLKYATGLMTFFSSLQVWEVAGLRLREDRTVCNLSRVDEPLISRVAERPPAQKRLRYPPLPRAAKETVVFDPNDLTI